MNNQYSGYGPNNPYNQPPNQYSGPPYPPSQPPFQGSQQPYQGPNSYYGPPPYPGPPGPYGNPPPYGNQNNIPDFKLIGRGNGIDEREFYVITHAAYDALNLKEDPLSNGIIKRIKKDLGGEWMVFASIEGLKGYDFSLSIVTGNDFLSFTIRNFRFQVCRLRD